MLQLSADDTQGVFTALEQIVSKGAVSAEELRGQLGERLPGAFQIAARSLGVTTQTLDEMLRKGEVLAEDLLPRLADELRESVAEGLPDATESAAADFERLENAVLNLNAAIADGFLLDWLARAAEGATAVVEALTPEDTSTAARVLRFEADLRSPPQARGWSPLTSITLSP